ncbi:hypothetical protein K466DRAFT_286487 [Polyporus arcularius HHB13444]|uniref:Uncharacterized protein n=1 Tax=Polyporus arcularius HHB13444 TaxID=1314778 RepID=A0A5C3P2D6_9APHY|nr:hypothetical protein K466DRAFT_286487 [Polyporus arcularius HHB13444]
MLIGRKSAVLLDARTHGPSRQSRWVVWHEQHTQFVLVVGDASWISGQQRLWARSTPQDPHACPPFLHCETRVRHPQPLRPTRRSRDLQIGGPGTRPERDAMDTAGRFSSNPACGVIHRHTPTRQSWCAPKTCRTGERSRHRVIATCIVSSASIPRPAVKLCVRLPDTDRLPQSAYHRIFDRTFAHPGSCPPGHEVSEDERH